jgi:hypothetical protein
MRITDERERRGRCVARIISEESPRIKKKSDTMVEDSQKTGGKPAILLEMQKLTATKGWLWADPNVPVTKR